MTEVNESFFNNTLSEINQNLSALEADYKGFSGGSKLESGNTHNCCVNAKEWCHGEKMPSKEGYGKWLNIREQINFLKGQLSATMRLLKDFMSSKKAEGESKTDAPPKEDCTAGCDGSDSTPAPSGDTSSAPADEPSTPPSQEPSPADDAGTTSVPTEPAETPVDEFAFLDQQDFASFMRETLGKDSGDKVGEVALYHGAVSYLLENLHGVDARDMYQSTRSELKAKPKTNAKQASKEALRGLSTSTELTQADIDKIHQIAHYAAQLDTKQKTLSNMKEGKSEKINQAAKNTFSDIASALRGEITVGNRTLF